ncbi:MAG: RNA polymerase sigma factor [Verrucomicrobia bacterium]|nr:RNA polymerase sigma factor [Verrucomicrobiota bacterium]
MSDDTLERLYDAHADALFAFVLSVCRDVADTRDVLQEVFIRLAQRPELLRGIRDERAFLIRLAHNATLDCLRRRDSRRRAHEGFAEEPPRLFAFPTDPDEAAFQQELMQGLEELPPEQRAVVHLKLWGGLTFDQISDALEIPLNTAASRYRYGLDKLRARLRPLYDEIR